MSRCSRRNPQLALRRSCKTRSCSKTSRRTTPSASAPFSTSQARVRLPWLVSGSEADLERPSSRLPASNDPILRLLAQTPHVGAQDRFRAGQAGPRRQDSLDGRPGLQRGCDRGWNRYRLDDLDAVSWKCDFTRFERGLTFSRVRQGDRSQAH